MAKNNIDAKLEAELEEVVFTLNEIRHKRFQELRKAKTKLEQEKVIEKMEKDIDVCVTKIGLYLK